MATDDAPAPDERAGAGVSQESGRMLPATPLWGHASLPSSSDSLPYAIDAVKQVKSLENKEHKGRRPDVSLSLTPVDRGYKILLVRGT